MKFVVALGGNMISDAKKKGEKFEEQLAKLEYTAKVLISLVEDGHDLVVSHGNGPQVGSLLLQQQANVSGATNLPLNILGALTQGQIGVSLQHALINELRARGIDKQVFVIPTSVLIDKNDPGFSNPTKPVGPFYSDEDFAILDKADYIYKEMKAGHRRVVASPVPLEILEADLIGDLMNMGHLTIAVGGGGTPTIDDEKLTMVDAVIDKDMASSVLARSIDADVLMILTNVEGVYSNFGTEQAKMESQLDLERIEELLNSDALGEGSMKPKVLACKNFVSLGNKKAIITSPEFALEALKGLAGTNIVS